MNSKIYVGNLPPQTTDADLKAHFSRAGEVVSVKVVRDPQSGLMRGFAFIEMSTRREAQKAVSMLNKQNFMEKELLVKEARAHRSFNRGR